MNNTMPRLGRLQWVGPALVGIAGAIIANSQEPLFGYRLHSEFDGLNPLLPGIYNFWGVLIYSPFLIAIAATLVGAFRALAAAPHRQEFHALIALGANRRGLKAHQVREGAVHGAIFAIGGLVVGAIYRQVSTGIFGELNSRVAWTLLAFAGVGMVAIIAAYALVARWITSTPGTSSRRAATASKPGRPRLSRSWPWVAVAIVIAAPMVMKAWEASGYQYSGGSTRPMWAKLLVTTAGTLQLLSIFAVMALLILAGARAAAALTKVASRALSRGADGTGVRAIAADGLSRPTPVRGIAMVGIGIIMTITTAVSMGANAADARNHLAADLNPDAVVSTFPIAAPTLGPVRAGTTTAEAPDGLPVALLNSFLEDPRLIVVPTAVILTDPATAEGGSRHRVALLAPDARAFDAVSKGAARDLFFTDGYSWGYRDSIVVDGRRLELHSASVSAPLTGVPRAWAESNVGALPTSAVLLYPAGETPVVDVLADYDLAGITVTRPTLPHSSSDNSTQASTLFGVAGPFLLLAIGLVIALAFTVQRLRAGDYATMTALGATRSALRGATAIESAMTTLIGAVLGMAFGVAIGAYTTTITAMVGLTQLDATIWWNIGFDIVHAPWITLWALTLAATGLAAVGSLIARARADASTPAEQLREAIKEGAL